MMPQWVKVAETAEIPPGDSKAFIVQRESIAVFNVDGEYFAISNRCPHAAGPLVQGFVEKGRVVCPWHAWSFPLSPVNPPNDGVARYRVLIEDGQIYLNQTEFD